MFVVAVPPRPRAAYSLISARAVGSTPPRPRPARNRSTAKIHGFGAKAQNRVRTEKLMTVQSIVCRRPMKSLIVPTARAPTMTPTRPITDTSEAVFGVSPQPGSLSRAGSTTPRTTRSKPSSATASQQSGATQRA
jgi:hypothetical protein